MRDNKYDYALRAVILLLRLVAVNKKAGERLFCRSPVFLEEDST